MTDSSDDEVRYFLTRITQNPEKSDTSDVIVLQPPLTAEQWEEAERAMDILGESYRGFNIHLRIALDDFEEEISSFKQMLLEAPTPDETSKTRLVNKALVFSVALKMYEEHITSVVTRRWGKGAEEIEACKRAFSAVFDRSLAYRVVYALRNALVHSVVDVVTANYTVRLTNPSDPDSGVTSEVVVGVSREKFAATDVRAATRREVSELSSDPDLLQLSRDALMEVESLNVELEPVVHPDVEDATVFLWSITREHFPNCDHAPVLMALNRKAEPKSILPIPPVYWDYILRRGGQALALREQDKNVDTTWLPS